MKCRSAKWQKAIGVLCFLLRQKIYNVLMHMYVYAVLAWPVSWLHRENKPQEAEALKLFSKWSYFLNDLWLMSRKWRMWPGYRFRRGIDCCVKYVEPVPIVDEALRRGIIRLGGVQWWIPDRYTGDDPLPVGVSSSLLIFQWAISTQQSRSRAVHR